MKKFSALFLSLILFFSCTSIKTRTLNSFSSKDSESGLKYKGIPILIVTNKSKSPVKLKSILNTNKVTSLNFNNNVVVQVFIDSAGALEKIYLIKSVNKFCDSLVINAAKNSSFTIIKSNNKAIPYTFFVSYTFDKNDKIFPVINGCLTNNISDSSFREKNNILLFSDLKKPIKNIEQRPEIKFKTKPIYPQYAREAGVQGIVVAEVIVDEYGNVIDAIPFKSIPILNEAAIETAYKFKFKPAIIDKKRFKVAMHVPFIFKFK